MDVPTKKLSINDLCIAIQKKNDEIEEIQSDINSLEERAASMKEIVKEYKQLKYQAAQFKGKKKALKKELNTVLNFIKAMDEHYLDSVMPLFSPANITQETANA